jgi:hypothetical protein
MNSPNPARTLLKHYLDILVQTKIWKQSAAPLKTSHARFAIAVATSFLMDD